MGYHIRLLALNNDHIERLSLDNDNEYFSESLSKVDHDKALL